jgi:hypothetical protein
VWVACLFRDLRVQSSKKVMRVLDGLPVRIVAGMGMPASATP